MTRREKRSSSRKGRRLELERRQPRGAQRPARGKPITLERWFVFRHVYGTPPVLVSNHPTTKDGERAARALVRDTLTMCVARITFTVGVDNAD